MQLTTSWTILALTYLTILTIIDYKYNQKWNTHRYFTFDKYNYFMLGATTILITTIHPPPFKILTIILIATTTTIISATLLQLRQQTTQSLTWITLGLATYSTPLLITFTTTFLLLYTIYKITIHTLKAPKNHSWPQLNITLTSFLLTTIFSYITFP